MPKNVIGAKGLKRNLHFLSIKMDGEQPIYACRGCYQGISREGDPTVVVVMSPLDPSSTPHATHNEGCARRYYEINGVNPAPQITDPDKIKLSEFERRVAKHADALEPVA